MVEGSVRDDFHRVAEVFAHQLDRTSGGASVAVFHQGELVVDLWGGYCDGPAGRPWRRDTLAMCFSTTKGVVATAAHVLKDRGLLDYDEPVATYWPEFAQNGKSGITMRHVLSHSAGLHRVGTLVDGANRMLDWSHMTDALAAATPAYPPGSTVGYHGLTFGWLVGEVVRRISGRSLNDFVQDNLAKPLGVDGLYIGCPPQARDRAAALKPSMPKLQGMSYLALRQLGYRLAKMGVPFNARRIRTTLIPRGIEDILASPEMLDVEVPAMNGHFDAVSLASMYAMLANHGQFRGVRLLSPQTVADLSEVQNSQRDRVVVVRMRWRLGYHGLPVGSIMFPSLYGHLGFGGSGAWADPAHDLALAMVCNRGGGTPFADMRIMTLTAAVAQSVLRPARRPPKVTA
jgi:CubicO group peptidase (beta-lactamase class C family)